MKCAAAVLALFLALPAHGAISRIVILGDSVARGAGDETGGGIAGALAAMTKARVQNLGINGGRTANVLQLLAQPAARNAVRSAQLIVLSIGGNDLYGNAIEKWRSMLAPRIAEWFVARRVRRVVETIREQNRSAPIVLLGLYNPYRESVWGTMLDEEIARWDSRIIDAFATDRALNVVRIADLIDTPGAISPLDHFHPSAFGYRSIAQRIAAAYTFSRP